MKSAFTGGKHVLIRYLKICRGRCGSHPDSTYSSRGDDHFLIKLYPRLISLSFLFRRALSIRRIHFSMLINQTALVGADPVPCFRRLNNILNFADRQEATYAIGKFDMQKHGFKWQGVPGRKDVETLHRPEAPMMAYRFFIVGEVDRFWFFSKGQPTPQVSVGVRPTSHVDKEAAEGLLRKFTDRCEYHYHELSLIDDLPTFNRMNCSCINSRIYSYLPLSDSTRSPRGMSTFIISSVYAMVLMSFSALGSTVHSIL